MDRYAMIQTDKNPLTWSIPDFNCTRPFRWSGPKCKDKWRLEEGDMVYGNEI
jgi:hypothetical protein